MSAGITLTVHGLAVFALGFALGCSNRQNEARSTPAAEPVAPMTEAPASQPLAQQEAPPAQPPSRTPSNQQEGYLSLSKGVQSRCDLPETPREAPQFDFDESQLRERGRKILDGIVQCMRNGALREEGITIVGHADPRGPEGYNRDLGRRRAETARDYLLGQGVSAGRITVRSRGEAEAQGTGPDSWQLDRRVDIEESSGAQSSLAR